MDTGEHWGEPICQLLGVSYKLPLAPEKCCFLLQVEHLILYLPPPSLRVCRAQTLWAALFTATCTPEGRVGLIECLVIVILCRGPTPVPSGEGIAVLVEAKIEKWTEGWEFPPTLPAELQFDTALLMRPPLSLCSTWVPGAVLIALNFLPKGLGWQSKLVMCLHCPPCRSGELLQVRCLVAFILEKIAPFG